MENMPCIEACTASIALVYTLTDSRELATHVRSLLIWAFFSYDEAKLTMLLNLKNLQVSQLKV